MNKASKRLISIGLTILMLMCSVPCFAWKFDINDFNSYINKDLIENKNIPTYQEKEAAKIESIVNETRQQMADNPTQFKKGSDMEKVACFLSTLQKEKNKSLTIGWEEKYKHFATIVDLNVLQYIIRRQPCFDDIVKNKNMTVLKAKEATCNNIKEQNLSDKAKQAIYNTVNNTLVFVAGIDDYTTILDDLTLQNIDIKSSKDGGSFADNLKQVKKYEKMCRNKNWDDIKEGSRADNLFSFIQDINSTNGQSFFYDDNEMIVISAFNTIQMLLLGESQDAQQCSLAITLGHELGHMVGSYFPTLGDNIAYGILGVNSTEEDRKIEADRCKINLKNKMSNLNKNDIDYLNSVSKKIANYFNNIDTKMELDGKKVNIKGEAVFGEVFADLNSIRTSCAVADSFGIDKSNVFKIFAMEYFDRNYDVADMLYPFLCSYPIPPFRVSGVLAISDKFLEWAKDQ